MTDEKNITPQQTDEKQADPKQTEQVAVKESNPVVQLVVFAVIVAVLAYLAVQNPRAARAVALVALGFGGVVMIHELGHFIVAKLGGIKVEAFSIGFPPVFLGIRKLKKGFRFRLLPRPGQTQQIEAGDNETEYQIGLVPLGGFVKMLGQSDTGSVEQTEDPRSFINRPTWIRIAVVAAGVTFNAIAAMLLFMALFSRGIDLIPAVVGNVLPNSPAHEAGLRPGDEVVAVNGERFVDYESLLLAPVLSGRGEPISLTVRRDDREETIRVVAEQPAVAVGEMAGMRSIGVSPAHTLTIAPEIARDPDDVQWLYDLTGLRPGDEIKAVNNQPIRMPWEFREKVSQTLTPMATLTVSRSWPKGSARTQQTVTFPVRIGPVVPNFRQEFDLAHIFGIKPVLKVTSVADRPQVMGLTRRLADSIRRLFAGEEETDNNGNNAEQKLMAGDLLIRIGQAHYPNFKEVRTITEEHKNQDLTLVVLRPDPAGELREVELTVRPFEVPRSDRVTIGFAAELAMDRTMTAQLFEDVAADVPPQIPSGSTIVSVDGRPVETFFEVAQILRDNRGKRVSIEFVDAQGRAGGTGMVVPERGGIHMRSELETGLASLPFEELRVTYEADNSLQAIGMGFKKVRQFVVRTVLTLYRLIFGQLPATALMGPVGIITVSYTIADASLIHYLYFLGLLSSILAVMNLMPLPVLDGGVIVMLTIEKIIGRPINEKVQAAVTYVGLALILALMLMVTYNDILRLLFG